MEPEEKQLHPFHYAAATLRCESMDLRDQGHNKAADDFQAAAAYLDNAATQPAPLGDAELAELEKVQAGFPRTFITKGLEIGTVAHLRIAKMNGNKNDDLFAQSIAKVWNAVPGLLARVRQVEAELASYKPAPLPTGWVLRGELDPEEQLRCEIELQHHGEGQPALYATYWAGREGDFATWTDEQGNWYHDYEVVRYRYAPAQTVKGGSQDA